jgi:hypothetical protein
MEMITKFHVIIRRCALDKGAACSLASRLRGIPNIRTMSSTAKPKVFVTRNVPASGLSLLKESCEVTQWTKDDPIPRSQLLQGVKGVDALFCLLTDKIDTEVLEAAGKHT